MANPAIVSVGTPATASSLTIPFAYPATVIPNKKIFALLSDFNATSSMAATPSADWVKIVDIAFGVGASLRKFYLLSKIANGSETGTVTFTTDRNTRKVGWMFSTNTATVHAISTGSSGDALTELNHDQLTPSVPNALLIYIIEAIKATAIAVTDITPGGTDLGAALTFMTEVARNQTNSNYLGACYELHPTATQAALRKSTTTVTPGALGQIVLALAADPISITSVNGGDAVVDGQQDVIVVHTGFSTITAVTLICGSFQKALSFTNSNGTTTLVDFPDIASLTDDALGVPFTATGFDLVLRISDGIDTENEDIVLVVKDGYEKVDIADAITTLGSVFYEYDDTAPDGTQVYRELDEYNTVLFANGGIETDAPSGTTFVFKIFNPDTGMWNVISHTLKDIGSGYDSEGEQRLIQPLISNFTSDIHQDVDSLIYR